MRRSDGGVYRVAGRYLELSPPTGLTFTWTWEAGAPADFHDETTVSVHLAPHEGGTRVRVRHERIPASLAAAHAEGWRGALRALAEL